METSSSPSASSGIFGRPISNGEIASKTLPVDHGSLKMEEMTLRILDLEKLICQRDQTIQSLEATVEKLKEHDDELLLIPVDSELDNVVSFLLNHLFIMYNVC